jgi:mannonate dehydratase
MSDIKITAVQTFITQPCGQRLIVVKVLTNQPGLYGLGCATFTQRHMAVKAALEHHVGPLALGRDPRDIEDFWQVAMVNGYWRSGPVLNNAASGLDMALWDIKGKLAGMPCYDLWGGKCRPAAAVYVHADGNTPEEASESVRRFMAQGYQYIRCQLGGYPGTDGRTAVRPDGPPPEYEMFPGTPELRGGFAYPNARPGLGIEFNESLAAKYPPDDKATGWTESRLPDGTLWRP